MRTRRYLFLAAISVVIGLFVVFAVAEVVLRFLPVQTGLRALSVSDQNPVMRFTPDRAYVFSRGWNFTVVNRGQVNNYGFVNDQSYEPAATAPLLAIIGDSFIEAVMVPYAETVQGRLASSVGNRGRVYSFASSGSPLSQYLVYAQYARDTFRPQGMVFLVIGNDFDESLLKYKSAPGFHYFREEMGRLELARVDYAPSWTRQIARESALVRYVMTNMYLIEAAAAVVGERKSKNPSVPQYVGNVPARTTPERIEDSKRAIRAFFDELPKRSGLDNRRIIFVLDGMRPSLYTEKGLKAAEGSYFDQMRRFFLQEAHDRDYEAIDMQPRFISRHRVDGSLFEFATDGHWNGLGHGVAAEALSQTRMFQRIFPRQN
mgnify:CR=1 FL=1